MFSPKLVAIPIHDVSYLALVSVDARLNFVLIYVFKRIFGGFIVSVRSYIGEPFHAVKCGKARGIIVLACGPH